MPHKATVSRESRPTASGAVQVEAGSARVKRDTQKKGWIQHVYRPIRVAGGIGAALLLALLLFEWAVVPVLLPKTREALMNAPVAVIRAPVDGTGHVTHAVGDVVRAGERVGYIKNELFDMTPVWRLETEKTTLEAARIRDIADRDEARRRESLAADELAKYRVALIEQVNQKLIAVDSKVEEMSVAVKQSWRVARMNFALLERGLIPAEDASRSTDAMAVAEQRLAQAQSERATLDAQLNAIQRNTFTERDTPIYLTWWLQAGQTVRAIEARLEETERRLAAVQAELIRSRELIDRLKDGDILSPVSGVVWKIDASSARLVKGEPVLQIAEAPERAFIEAPFQEAHAKSLVAGTRVIVAFSGYKAYTGVVYAVRQPNPTDLESMSAIKLGRRLNEVKAYISLDAHALEASLLGRQCRVLVADPHTSPLQSPMVWTAAQLFMLLGW